MTIFKLKWVSDGPRQKKFKSYKYLLKIIVFTAEIKKKSLYKNIQFFTRLYMYI